jgi:hypothetical protein
VDALLPTVLLFLFLATFVFTYVDWQVRRKKLGGTVAPSWDCPHCGVVNEAERSVCWACSAAISANRFFPEMGPMAADTWRCRRCGAWNGTNRRTCWSCSNAPSKQPKRQA